MLGMESTEKLYEASSIQAGLANIDITRHQYPSRSVSSRNEISGQASSPYISGMPIKIASVLPLLLALLPAAVSLLIDEYAGALLADAILLTVVGYALWGMSEWSWSFYVDTIVSNTKLNNDLTNNNVASLKHDAKTNTRSKNDSIESNGQHSKSIGRFNAETNKETNFRAPTRSIASVIALLISLSSPFVGAILLHLARQHLSAGSVLVTDFNILLYLILEILRSIHRIAGFSITDSNVLTTVSSSIDNHNLRNAALIQLQAQLNHHQEYLQQVENQVDSLGEELGSLGRRVLRNEASVQSDIYTIYKGFEEVNQDVRSLANGIKRVRTPKITSGSAKGNGRSLTPSVISDDSQALDKPLDKAGSRPETPHQRHLIKVRQFIPKTERMPVALQKIIKEKTSNNNQKPGIIRKIRNKCVAMMCFALWPYKQALKLIILPWRIIWKIVKVRS